MEALNKEGILKNPLIAAENDTDDSYIVLDGATRTSALKATGVRDALVQIVDYASEYVALDV